MAAQPTMEHLDVFKDILSRLFTGRIPPLVHQLALEGPEETFDTGIVLAVAFAAHAGNETVPSGYPLIAHRCILTAAIRIVHEPARGSPARQGHREGTLDEIPPESCAMARPVTSRE